LKAADVVVHGYRPGALDGLGFGPEERRKLNPGLIDISLCAYGWTGPWAGRRGFDSLVQMSAGIADAGMRRENADKPIPLPVQALDQATGYLLAAAMSRALLVRANRLGALGPHLARAYRVSTDVDRVRREAAAPACETNDDIAAAIEPTDWGPARRVKFPVTISGVSIGFSRPACELRSSPASW